MLRTEQEIKEAHDIFLRMLDAAEPGQVQLCIAAQLDSLRWALGIKGTKAENVLAFGLPMVRAERAGDEATADRIAAEARAETRRMAEAAHFRKPQINIPRFEIGDRVIYNANLDKSPDPENANTVGVVRAYTKEGHKFGNFDCPAGLCLVEWEKDAPATALENIHPINDDWLELVPVTPEGAKH